MGIEFLYDVAIEKPGEFNIKVPWGELGRDNEPRAKNWLLRYESELDKAERVSFLPKAGSSHMPVVSIVLDEKRRWILFSRVFGRTAYVERVRLYAIGWQQTVRGVNVKSILWVYPNGTVENIDEPTYWKDFIKK